MSNLNYSDFMKVDIRVGTILEAEENNKLKQPSIILKINFGEQIAPKNRLKRFYDNWNYRAFRVRYPPH